MAKDPVCEMEVNPKNAPESSVFKGKTYFFCSQTCKKSLNALGKSF